MKGLLLKDWMLMKKRGAIFLMILVVYFFVGLMGTDTMVFGYMIVVLAPMLVISTFSYEEAVKWNMMAAVLPISRKKQVQGRFLTALIAIGLSTLVCLLQNGICFLKNTDPEIMKVSLLILLLFLSATLIYISVTFTLIYWFGAEKGRYVMIFGAVLIGALLGGSGAISGSLMENWQRTLSIGSLVLFAISVLLFFICYLISARIYEKKDF